MENVFSKVKVTPGLRMYATKDKKQRFYGKDLNYFVSYTVKIIGNTDYTVTNAYTYAVLDMYGETLYADYCNGTTEINTKVPRAYYIVVCGLLSKIDSIMVIDAPKQETGDNPSYIPHGSGSGETVVVKIVTSLVANNFVYNQSENTYTVSDMSPTVSAYSDLGDEFTLYVTDIDTLEANSSISLFGNKFNILHINNEPLTTKMESVASVMPFLCSKNAKTARMLYSYVSTSQTGLGLEDLFLDVGDEPFKEDE